MATSAILDLIGRPLREPAISPLTADDALLVDGLRKGVEHAYELLIDRFQQPVYNLALRLVSDPSDAGDIVQEVFLKVFRSIHLFRGGSSLRTWIYRIAVNEAHNRRRWIYRHRSHEIGLEKETQEETGGECRFAGGDPSPYDQTLSHERYALIEQALARINPDFRAAVVLRDIEDLNYDEIAEILGISIGTVKSRILRGRDALRLQLGDLLRPETAVTGSRV